MMIKMIRNRKFLYFYFNFILCNLKNIFFKNINDASTKIKNQDINITDTNGYAFNTRTPISAVYIGDISINYAIVSFSNVVMIRSFISFGTFTTCPARVYYI